MSLAISAVFIFGLEQVFACKETSYAKVQDTGHVLFLWMISNDL